MKIVVTGGNGMMGRTIKDIVNNIDYKKDNTENEFIFLSRQDCDLVNREEVLNYFINKDYDYIIHLAAAVGGLYKNLNANIDMFSLNIKINENILEACHLNGIKRGIFVLSSCIYPANPSRFPMDETMIHESPPHSSNEGYAYAKRMLELQCRQYNKAYNYEYICVVPVNLYGPYDNFNLQDSHMVPGLMHRFYLTNLHGNKEYEAYGTGAPLRQFLYSFDFAKIILKILFGEKNPSSEPIICCNAHVYSIKEIVETLTDVMEIDNNHVYWNKTKSDGCMKKTVTNKKLLELYPEISRTFTNLKEGLMYTYLWFVNNYEHVRK